MKYELLPLTMFQSNCVILWDEESGDGIVFDPGGEGERIVRLAADLGVTVKALFLTHGHVDHVSGTNDLRESTQAPSSLHRLDWPVAEQTPRQCLMFGIPLAQAPTIDREHQDGEVVKVGALSFKVLHTPGHSPGSCCFHFEREQLLVAGDLLFAGSIGRTDLPGGSHRQMAESLQRMQLLPDETVVISGHGPETTIGREKRTNPYMNGSYGLW